MISRMDRYIGRVIDLIDKLGLAQNTIIVFTSDNGTTHLRAEVDYNFFESVKPLRGLKGSLYEGGIRVPLIVRWPGRVPAGTTSKYVTGLEDWMVTIHELVGVKKPVIIFIEVDLPAPFGPRKPNTSPLFTESEILSTAFIAPNDFVSPITSTSVSANVILSL